MTDAATIAKGLTKAQRLGYPRPHQIVEFEYVLDFPMVGLFERHPQYGAKWRLTPLGLAVRAILAQETDA